MINERRSHRTYQNALLASAMLMGVVLFGVRNAVPQDQVQERSFVVESTNSNDPVQIVGFRIGGSILSPTPGFKVEGRLSDPGVSFQATNEDWLEKASVIIRDVPNSKRTVMGIWISLFFPESYNGQVYVGTQLSVGHMSPPGMYDRNGRKIADTLDSPIAVAPGQTIEIPLGPKFEYLTGLFQIAGKRLSDMKECKVRIVAVYFTDGMKWGPGWFGRPDPDNPGRYIQIMPSEFYGYVPRNH